MVKHFSFYSGEVRSYRAPYNDRTMCQNCVKMFRFSPTNCRSRNVLDKEGDDVRFDKRLSQHRFWLPNLNESHHQHQTNKMQKARTCMMHGTIGVSDVTLLNTAEAS